jgi:hypothetical protein
MCYKGVWGRGREKRRSRPLSPEGMATACRWSSRALSSRAARPAKRSVRNSRLWCRGPLEALEIAVASAIKASEVMNDIYPRDARFSPIYAWNVRGDSCGW